MHIIVLAKQVPDIEKVQFQKDNGWVDRKSADAEINPFDLNALEAAQQLKEKLGATVTVLSMGPASAEAVLKEGIARDADRGILLTDDAFAGADTLATAYTLAAAIRKIGAFDLILCGEKTVDGDTGQVGPAVAERLGIPHLAFVSELTEVSENSVAAVTETASGSLKVESVFPLLVAGIIAGDWKKNRMKEVFRDSLLVTAGFIALFAPWLAKNWVITGNPAFPVLFGGYVAGRGAANADAYFAE